MHNNIQIFPYNSIDNFWTFLKQVEKKPQYFFCILITHWIKPESI